MKRTPIRGIKILFHGRGLECFFFPKGGEIRGTKTLNLSRNIVTLQVLVDVSVPFLTLHDQLDPQQKHLLQVEEMQRSDWLICQSASKLVAHQVVSLMKNEQQSQNLLHKVDQRSTFRDNFLHCATS